ncbi:PREDICTED: uncharacterized protein LOC109151056 isoform X2 [Ipomoea nil]|uniref:uncharacterized protein LOC109151056 isoform X2 n=1 Tax=Ipomoea nil TaxID=35883 RepID=UPI000900C84B|nr:PREDICTED: uncharacterized protein LOC109151056 isoform X2 [Ipomoea nil]
MAKHGKASVDAKALTKTKNMRRRKKISKKNKSLKSSMQGRNCEVRDLEHQDSEHDSTLISQHNNKRKGKRTALPQSQDLLLQSPSAAILEVLEDLHRAEGPSTSSSELNSHNKTFIQPIGNTTFEPCSVHTDIMPCVKRIFPEAVKTFKTAPQHLKDAWFNEFKKRHEWDPNDEDTVRMIFEKRAAKLLADALSDVRTRLALGSGVPGWISDHVLAQYQVIWNSNEFKKTSEKNKRNRNSDCGGLGPSLHTAGSIPITEHRRRLKEKLGKEPTHIELFNATHQHKQGGGYVCQKAQQVIETVTHLKQTQPEVAEAEVWLEATGGVRKMGYVSGFGSDTQHYFPEATIQRKLKIGPSTSHVSCEARIKELEDQNRALQQQHQDMEEQHRSIRETVQKMEAAFAHLSQFSVNLSNHGPNLDGMRSNSDQLPTTSGNQLLTTSGNQLPTTRGRKYALRIRPPIVPTSSKRSRYFRPS